MNFCFNEKIAGIQEIELDIFQSPAQGIPVVGGTGEGRTPALDEIDDVFFNSPNPTSPYVVQMRQNPFARMASPHTPQLVTCAGDSPGLPAIQGSYWKCVSSTLNT